MTSSRREGAILQTAVQRPFSSKGVGNFMAARIGKAGLPDRCVTHGLRKAAARRLAGPDCSANEIASITGNASLEEVARYTRAAEQRKLARSAMDRLVRERSVIPIPGQSEGLGLGGGRVGTNVPDSTKEINKLERGWRPVGDGLTRRHKPLIYIH